MEATFEEHVQERAVLVGLNADCFTKAQTATDETLEELEALLETAGGFCTAKILQNRHAPDSHSFIGEGKAQEVRMLVEATASTMVVFDNELSPGHIRALEDLLGLTVLDPLGIEDWVPEVGDIKSATLRLSYGSDAELKETYDLEDVIAIHKKGLELKLDGEVLVFEN